MLDRLEAADRPAELAALLEVAHGELEAGLGAAELLGGQGHGGDVESPGTTASAEPPVVIRVAGASVNVTTADGRERSRLSIATAATPGPASTTKRSTPSPVRAATT